MRRTPSFVLLAALITLPALTATAALAQDDGMQRVGQAQQIFFSPSGQPFRATSTDPYPSALWFAQADKDKDGKISHDEFVADAVQFFNQLDVNHDGYINSPENTRYENQVAPEILSVDGRIAQPKFRAPEPDSSSGADQDPNGGKYRKTIIGAAQYGLIDEPQPIRAADANFDFRVSRDEWAATSSQRFTILDRNGDGYITLDELPKTPIQLALEAPKKGKDKKKGFGW